MTCLNLIERLLFFLLAQLRQTQVSFSDRNCLSVVRHWCCRHFRLLPQNQSSSDDGTMLI